MWDEGGDDEGLEDSCGSPDSELLVDELGDKILDFLPAGVNGDQAALCSPFYQLVTFANQFLKGSGKCGALQWGAQQVGHLNQMRIIIKQNGVNRDQLSPGQLLHQLVNFANQFLQGSGKCGVLQGVAQQAGHFQALSKNVA